MRDFFTDFGPVSFMVEALRILCLGLLLMGVAFVLGGNYPFMLLIIAGYTLGVASRYVWWHFRPSAS